MISFKLDAITTPIKEFQNLDALTLHEVIGTLKAHEDKLKERSTKRDGNSLPAWALGKSKKKDFANSRGRGKGYCRDRGHDFSL